MKRYNLGLYDPCDLETPIEVIGREFHNTSADLREMRLTIQEFNRLAAEDKTITMALGIFPALHERATA